MPDVDCQLVRWVDNETFPWIVEAHLVDAAGVTWTFIEKSVVFTSDNLAATSDFPIASAIRCTIPAASMDDDPSIVLVDTSLPDGVESVEGVPLFRVRSEFVRQ